MSENAIPDPVAPPPSAAIPLDYGQRSKGGADFFGKARGAVDAFFWERVQGLAFFIGYIGASIIPVVGGWRQVGLAIGLAMALGAFGRTMAWDWSHDHSTVMALAGILIGLSIPVQRGK